jgi:endonuclease G
VKSFCRNLLLCFVFVTAVGPFTAAQAFPIPIHPVSQYLVKRGSYLLCYDAKHRQPRWVYERLTEEGLKGETERKNYDFQEDPLIPEPFRSTSKDYQKSGYDRGHLCPAADAKSSPETMSATFYLSNTSPQMPQFNRGYWFKFEKYVRELAKLYPSLHVYTGALYLPKNSEGKKYIKYEVIGPNDVAVPTHFFKVIFVESEKEAEAYILPNEHIPKQTDLEDFRVPLEQVEKSAGLLFSSLEDGF